MRNFENFPFVSSQYLDQLVRVCARPKHFFGRDGERCAGLKLSIGYVERHDSTRNDTYEVVTPAQSSEGLTKPDGWLDTS